MAYLRGTGHGTPFPDETDSDFIVFDKICSVCKWWTSTKSNEKRFSQIRGHYKE